MCPTSFSSCRSSNGWWYGKGSPTRLFWDSWTTPSIVNVANWERAWDASDGWTAPSDAFSDERAWRDEDWRQAWWKFGGSNHGSSEDYILAWVLVRTSRWFAKSSGKWTCWLSSESKFEANGWVSSSQGQSAEYVGSASRIWDGVLSLQLGWLLKGVPRALWGLPNQFAMENKGAGHPGTQVTHLALRMELERTMQSSPQMELEYLMGWRTHLPSCATASCGGWTNRQRPTPVLSATSTCTTLVSRSRVWKMVRWTGNPKKRVSCQLVRQNRYG